MTLDSLELEFENCEYIEIPNQYVLFFHADGLQYEMEMDISKNVSTYTSCSSCKILLHKDALSIPMPTSGMTLEERLTSMMDVCAVYLYEKTEPCDEEDENCVCDEINEPIGITLPWGNENETLNSKMMVIKKESGTTILFQ